MNSRTLAEYLDLSRDRALDLAALPDFPRPARPGGTGQPRWLRSEVEQWMRSQQS